jgi:subtilisin family serine protease
MKKGLGLLALAFIIFACKKSTLQSSDTPVEEQGQHLSNQQINKFIQNQLSEKGSFDWKDATDEMVWSALVNTDSIMSVGYKPTDENSIDGRQSAINISDDKWKAAKQQVLQLIFDAEKKSNPSMQMQTLEVWREDKLPVIDVKISSLQTVKLLRQSNLVRYTEPMGYDPIEVFDKQDDQPTARSASDGLFGGSGCGEYSANNSLIAGVDYTSLTPNAKVSWNYGYHRIEQAWTKSTGAGVKVMVIDTGVSPDQDNLGSEFNQGYSQERTLEKIVTMPGETNANDGCGHGTTMSGTIAAPRCTDGNTCGVAYNCNLVVCRATKDVYIDGSSEVKGVSDAYTRAGDNSSIKIISMSMGRVTNSGQLKDAIQYANGKGKLMFCAAGTSKTFLSTLLGVLFPANLDEVQAITGVKDNSSLTVCEACHKGKQVDFVVVMQKQNSGLKALSTAVSGDVPTIVGGSSVATATASGIAALVWSKFPSYSRDQLINKLMITSSGYPNKSSSFGWGKLNADAATN